jgi:hypothetical protein
MLVSHPKEFSPKRRKNVVPAGCGGWEARLYYLAIRPVLSDQFLVCASL